MANPSASSIAVTAGSGTAVGVFTTTRNAQTEDIQAILPLEWTYGIITAAGTQSFLGLDATSAATFLVGYQNLSASTQVATFIAYDNASAGSGQVVTPAAALGPGQIVTYPGPGLKLANGLTIVTTGTPGSSGIMVMVR